MYEVVQVRHHWLSAHKYVSTATPWNYVLTYDCGLGPPTADASTALAVTPVCSCLVT